MFYSVFDLTLEEVLKFSIYLTFQPNKHFCFDLEASQHEPKHTSMAASKSRIFYNRMAVDVLYLMNDYMDNSTSYYRELFYMYYLS